ncbi:hypothetical protein DSUL_20312 [Desulfovibrionales bacterium]
MQVDKFLNILRFFDFADLKALNYKQCTTHNGIKNKLDVNIEYSAKKNHNNQILVHTENNIENLSNYS